MSNCHRIWYVGRPDPTSSCTWKWSKRFDSLTSKCNNMLVFSWHISHWIRHRNSIITLRKLFWKLSLQPFDAPSSPPVAWLRVLAAERRPERVEQSIIGAFNVFQLYNFGIWFKLSADTTMESCLTLRIRMPKSYPCVVAVGGTCNVMSSHRVLCHHAW